MIELTANGGLVNENQTFLEGTARFLSQQWIRKTAVPVIAAGTLQYFTGLSPELTIALAASMAGGISMVEDKWINPNVDSGRFMGMVGRAVCWGALAGGITKIGNIPAVDQVLSSAATSAALAMRATGHVASEGFRFLSGFVAAVSPAISEGARGVSEWGKSLATEYSPKFATLPLTPEQNTAALKFWGGVGSAAVIGGSLFGAGWVALTPRPPAGK